MMSENNSNHGYPRFARITILTILANRLAIKSGYEDIYMCIEII